MNDFHASDRHVNRAIRSWLREDRHEDVSRVAGAVLDEVETIPQRRAWWPAWRTPMNKIVGFGVAAAAVVAVVVIGSQLTRAPTSGGVGAGWTPSPAPSTSEPSAEPSAAAAIDFAALQMGQLEEGDYVFTHLPDVRVVFAASSVWERNVPNWVVWTIDDNKATMGVATVDNVVIDPCKPELGFRGPAVGPTVDDLVTALRDVPGLTFSAPAEVSQDGYSGVRLDYVPPDEFEDCLDDMGDAVLMSVEGSVPADDGFIAPPNGADPFSLFIYDVDGTRVAVAASYTENRADELDEMLASIRFEQP